MMDTRVRVALDILQHHHDLRGELSDWGGVAGARWRQRWLKSKTRALINHDRVLRMDLGRMRPAGSGKE